MTTNEDARHELLSRYGPDCACCGESEPAFLHLHHVHGHGALHRRLIKPKDTRSNARVDSRQILFWLRKAGFPQYLDLGNGIYDELVVLCANCNHAIDQKGFCPHNPKAWFVLHEEDNGRSAQMNFGI